MVNRRTLRWRVRLRLSLWCQRLSWRLGDPHDAWLVSHYGPDGHRYGPTIHGPYSIARAFCREHKGRIDGTLVLTIPAGDDPSCP